MSSRVSSNRSSKSDAVSDEPISPTPVTPAPKKQSRLMRMLSRSSLGDSVEDDVGATTSNKFGSAPSNKSEYVSQKLSSLKQAAKDATKRLTFKKTASEKSYTPDDCAQDHFIAALGAAGAKDGRQGVFIDAASMKEKLRQNMDKPVYNVANFYHRTGLFQHIATHKVFEGVTLGVIAFNALWISIDTDFNHAEMLISAEPIFQIAEHFFCTYFAFEWFVRFMAFKRKRNGLRDAWFVFDSIMVFMMVAETWVMGAIMLATGAGGSGGMGNASILRLARLLRLSRMARMARLLRAMPELMILIKGMVAAMRSVFFTMLLLTILVYVFGILFTQLTADSIAGDTYFYSVPKSMHTLLLDGTLLDNVGTIVRALGEENLVFAAIFYIFVLLAALTVMNMLIGVLCEVVSAVAATEKEELTVGYVREQLEEVLKNTGIDEDGDGEISIDEFKKILENQQATRMLSEVGVDVEGLIDVADFIFEQGDENIKETGLADDKSEMSQSQYSSDKPKNLTFAKFMQVVLQMRGTNNATVKDIVDFRKFVSQITTRLKEKVDKFEVPVFTRGGGSFRKSTVIRTSGMSTPSMPEYSSKGSNGLRSTASVVEHGSATRSGNHLLDGRTHPSSKLENDLRSLMAELDAVSKLPRAGTSIASIPGQIQSPTINNDSNDEYGLSRQWDAIVKPLPDESQGADLAALQARLTRLKEAIQIGLPAVSSTYEKLTALKSRDGNGCRRH